MIIRNVKIYLCNFCGIKFSRDEAIKVCSNCFACTGCEIFICPGCGEEVVIKAIKKPNRDNINS